jgi:hypothetical protein
MAAFAAAREAFVEGLSAEEKAIFETRTSAAEIIGDLCSLEERHHDKSNSRKIMKKTDVFINGVERFEKVIDAVTKLDPTHATGIVWGGVQVILKVCKPIDFQVFLSPRLSECIILFRLSVISMSTLRNSPKC